MIIIYFFEMPEIEDSRRKLKSDIYLQSPRRFEVYDEDLVKRSSFIFIRSFPTLDDPNHTIRVPVFNARERKKGERKRKGDRKVRNEIVEALLGLAWENPKTQEIIINSRYINFGECQNAGMFGLCFTGIEPDKDILYTWRFFLDVPGDKHSKWIYRKM